MAVPLPDLPGVNYRFTTRADGDLQVGGVSRDLVGRRAALAPGEWTWLRQMHSADVVVVEHPGQHRGSPADAAVTTVTGAVLSVVAADCAPVLLAAPGGLAVIHAGWRGLLAGVVGAAADTLARLGQTPVAAVLGPTIAAHHYEFGEADLAPIAERFGPAVVASTAEGSPALDLPAAVGAAVGELGLELVDIGVCTACSADHWSYRARGDNGRHALVAWLDGP